MASLTVEERNWSALAHASGAVTMFFLPSFGFIAPMLIYMLKHQESPAIRYHGRQAVYFQLAMTLATWVMTGLGTGLSCFLIGFLFYIPALLTWLAGVIVPIIAAIKVNNGEDAYSYPLTGGMVERPLQLK